MNPTARRTALIVGASSGIGAALARELAARGWRVALASRREALLRDVAASLPHDPVVEVLDVTAPDAAARVESLIARLGRLDLFVYNSGWGEPNAALAPETELRTVAVNVTGFTALTNVVARTFVRQGHGHLVGISSIAGIRGAGIAPAYGASKAYMSTYLEALRGALSQTAPAVFVTDVQPGFVDTAMAKSPARFWVAPVEKAARQIADAIEHREHRAYVTKRWRWVAWVLRAMPDWAWLALQRRAPRS